MIKKSLISRSVQSVFGLLLVAVLTPTVSAQTTVHPGAPTPQIIIKEVLVPGPERVIIKEVPGPIQYVEKEVIREIHVPSAPRVVERQVRVPYEVPGPVQYIEKEVIREVRVPYEVPKLPSSGPGLYLFGMLAIGGAAGYARTRMNAGLKPAAALCQAI